MIKKNELKYILRCLSIIRHNILMNKKEGKLFFDFQKMINDKIYNLV